MQELNCDYRNLLEHIKKHYAVMDYVDRIVYVLENNPGKTQKGLSKAIGNDPTVANKIIKRTRKKITIHEFLKTAEYLEVSPLWLLTGEDNQQSNNTTALADVALLGVATAKKPNNDVVQFAREAMRRLMKLDPNKTPEEIVELAKALIGQANTN